ncbi:MAG: ChbG/HpnK family deacetylase [Candidatus Wallbacteria bacterium]|nr:ChbG/HpnK family deacetylase [Candidatus Wallbacteria bacterium]
MPLIVNADDFGLTPAVSRGILHAARAGVVSSTTVLANLVSDEFLVKLKKSGLSSGIHLNLTCGKPLLPVQEVRSLVGVGGEFHPLERLIILTMAGKIRAGEIRAELSAQVSRLRRFVTLSHFDGHRHFYFLHPDLAGVVIPLMKNLALTRTRFPLESRLFVPAGLKHALFTIGLSRFSYGLRGLLRRHGMVTPYQFWGQQFSGELRLRHLRRILPELKGCAELMTHPGFGDRKRELELKVLLRCRALRKTRLADFDAI